MQKKLSLEKKMQSMDVILIDLIMVKVFILDYFGIVLATSVLISALITFRLVCWLRKINKTLLISLGLLFSFYLVSLLLGVKPGTAIYNFAIMYMPLVMTVYFALMVRLNRNTFREAAKSLFPFFNIYLVLNLIIVQLQCRLHILVALNPGTADTTAATYWWDASSGLFEFFGTQSLCLYTIFVILYDIWYRERVCSDKKKGNLTILIVALIITSLFTALQNDNKAFFIMSPVAILVWFFTTVYKSKSRKTRLEILLGCIIICVVSLSIALSPLGGGILENIFNEIMLALSSLNNSTLVQGSMERIAIIPYAFTMPSTWGLGTGVGLNSFHNEGYLGFAHFGQTSMGSILVVCGIWFTILLCIIYISQLLSIGNVCMSRNNRGKIIAISFLFLLVVGYSTPLQNMSQCFCFILIVGAYGLLWEHDCDRLKKAPFAAGKL